jgi:hypothetical protein
MSFLGKTSILNNYNIISYHESIDENNLNLKNLSYFKELRKYKIKNKKDISFTNIETLHEFFVTQIEFIDKIDKDAKSYFYILNKKNIYSKEFWKNINNNLFYSLENQITKID